MSIEEEIKQKNFKNAQHKAVVNLIYTANWLQTKQQDSLKEYGITGQQYNILRILKGQHPKSISATEIKSRMLDKNSDVSRLLERLVLKGLVKKQTCPLDKRAADVYITDDGLTLLKDLQKYFKDGTAIKLTEEEAEQLSNLLDKCRD